MAYALLVLPTSAEFRTPADMVALAAISVGLYYAATIRTMERSGVDVLCGIIESRYRALMNGGPPQAVFHATVAYPEQLEQRLQGLADLPRPLVIVGMQVARNALSRIASTCSDEHDAR